MLRRLTRSAIFGVLVSLTVPAGAQEAKRVLPADGHTIHPTAPHVVAGKEMGPYHHYCKVLSPEPVIECLCYESDEPGARLHQVEYIIAKSITRNGAPEGRQPCQRSYHATQLRRDHERHGLPGCKGNHCGKARSCVEVSRRTSGLRSSNA